MAAQTFVELMKLKLKKNKYSELWSQECFPYRTAEDVRPNSACLCLHIVPSRGKKDGRESWDFLPPILQPICQCWGHCLLLLLPSCYLRSFNQKGLERQEGQKFLFWRYSLITYEEEEHGAETPNWTFCIFSSLQSILNTAARVTLWNLSQITTLVSSNGPLSLKVKTKVFTMVYKTLYALVFHALSDIVSNYYPTSLHSNLSLFLKHAKHTPAPGLLHQLLLWTWMPLSQQISTWLTLTSFKFLLKCHLVREPFPDHHIQYPRLVPDLSPLCACFITFLLIIHNSHRIIYLFIMFITLILH